MKKCRYASASIPDKIGAFFVYPLASFLIFSADLYFVYLFLNGLSNSSNIELVGFMGIGLVIAAISRLLFFLIRLCYQSFRMELRLFSISKEGISLGYSQKTTDFYSWEKIDEIAISAYQASASRQAYQTVICIFLEPRRNNFVQKILGSFYAMENMDRFVLIDYSEDVYAQLASVYFRKIEDYRPQQVVSYRK